MKYYYILNNYYSLLDSIKDKNVANCQLLSDDNDISLEPESVQKLIDHYHSDTTKIQTSENIQPVSLTISKVKQNGISSDITTDETKKHIPMIECDKKPIIAGDETIQDKILSAAYESLKYNQTSELSNMYFIADIAEAADIALDEERDEYEIISGFQFELEQEGFIRYDKKTGLIIATDKLLNKFRG